MAYKRSTMRKSKKTTYRKRRYRKAPAYRRVIEIKKEENPLNDTSVGGAADSEMIQISLTSIAQGDNTTNRAGNQIAVKYITGSAQVQLNDTTVPTWARCMIVQDKQTVADTIPSLSDILTDVALTSIISSPLNINTVGRFKVLYDRVIRMDAGSGVLNRFKWYLRPNTVVRFNGSASTDIQKNGLFLYIFTNKDNVNDPVTVEGYVRTGYSDL